MHRELVLNFFENAKCLLRDNGEIHLTYQNKDPYSKWNIEELASQSHLTLIERVDFKLNDYPGYKNKRGDGSRCDAGFSLDRSTTYKFVDSRKAMETLMHSSNRPIVHVSQLLHPSNRPIVHVSQLLHPNNRHVSQVLHSSNRPIVHVSQLTHSNSRFN